MRILILSQYFWPENFRINDLVTELAQRGHKITVLTGLPNYPGGDIFPEFRTRPQNFMNFSGAEVLRVPLVRRGSSKIRLALNYISFAFSAAIIGLWKLRGREFDAILTCQLSPATVGMPGVFFRFVKRAPMIFWVLDLWPESLRAVNVIRSPTALKWVGNMMTYIYNRCDLILVQSKAFIPQIKIYGKKELKIEYFPSWAENIFDLDDVQPAPELTSMAKKFNVMFAGNIGDAQDFPAILAAADQLKSNTSIRWLILGEGRASNWVNSEIKRRDLDDCFLMLGRFPLERMPSFFKHADVLLVSLKPEPIFAMTIPGKLQSYLAAGVPIVAMLNGEGADIVKKSKAGLSCDAGDHKALAAAVLRISQMTGTERELMGNNGKNYSADQFDRKLLIDRLDGWLKELHLKSLRSKIRDH